MPDYSARGKLSFEPVTMQDRGVVIKTRMLAGREFIFLNGSSLPFTVFPANIVSDFTPEGIVSIFLG